MTKLWWSSANMFSQAVQISWWLIFHTEPGNGGPSIAPFLNRPQLNTLALSLFLSLHCKPTDTCIYIYYILWLKSIYISLNVECGFASGPMVFSIKWASLILIFFFSHHCCLYSLSLKSTQMCIYMYIYVVIGMQRNNATTLSLAFIYCVFTCTACATTILLSSTLFRHTKEHSVIKSIKILLHNVH